MERIKLFVGRKLLLLLFSSALLLMVLCVGNSECRVSIPDDLEDVVDDEEDDDWKKWGSSKKNNKMKIEEFNPPKIDPSTMSPDEIRAEMLRHLTGPSIGFVKLRPGDSKRSKEAVPMIAMRWSKVLRTGSIDAKFMTFDLNTIMFNMEKGQDTEELIEFVLDQPEAYEIKIGEQFYRRPGDPPLDEVIEKLQQERSKSESNEDSKPKQQLKEEL